MFAVLGVLLWVVFRLVLPIVVLMTIGTVINNKYNHRSAI